MRGMQGLKSLFLTRSLSQKEGKTRTPFNLRPYHLLSMTKRRMARSADNAQITDYVLSPELQDATEVLSMKSEVSEQQHGPYLESRVKREQVDPACGVGQPTMKATFPLEYGVDNTSVGAHVALDEHLAVAAHRSRELHAAEVTTGSWQQDIGVLAPAKPRSLQPASGQRDSAEERYPTSTYPGIFKSPFILVPPHRVRRRRLGSGIGDGRARRRIVECSGIWKSTRRQRSGPPGHREPMVGLDFDILSSYIVPPTEPVTVMTMTQGSAPLPFPMPVVADVATGEYFFQTMSSSQCATSPARATISSYSELAQALGPPAPKTSHITTSHTTPEGKVSTSESSSNTPAASLSSDSTKALPASATPSTTVVSGATSSSPYISVLTYESPDDITPALAPPLAERKMIGLRRSAMIRSAHAKASSAAASGAPSNSPSLPPAPVQSPANANSVAGSADEHSRPHGSPDTPSARQLPSPTSQPTICTSQPAAIPIANEASIVDSTQRVRSEKEGDAKVSAVELNEASDIATASDSPNAPVHEPSIPLPIQSVAGQAEQDAMVSSVAEVPPPPEPQIPLSTEGKAAAGECPTNSTSETVPWNPLQDVIDTFFGNTGIIFTPPLPPEQHAVPESTPAVAWSDYLHPVSPGSTYDTASVFAQPSTLPAAASRVIETPLAGPSHSYAAPSYATYEPVQTTQYSNFLPPNMSDQWQQMHLDLTAVYNSSDMPMSPPYQSPVPSSQTFAVPYAPAPYEQQMTGDDDDDDDADMVRICSITSGMTLQEGTYDSQMGEYQGASSWNESGVYGFPEVVLVPSDEDAAMHYHETTESHAQPFYPDSAAAVAPGDQTAFTGQDPSQVFPSQSAYVPDASEFAVAASDVNVVQSNEPFLHPTPIPSEPVLPVEAAPSEELVVQPAAIEPEGQEDPQPIPIPYVDIQATTIVSAGDGRPTEESVCPTIPSVPQESSVLDVPTVPVTEPSQLETASDNPVVATDKGEETHPNTSPAPPPTDERVDDAVSALLSLSLSTSPAASTSTSGGSGSTNLRLEEPAPQPIPDMAVPAERPQIPLFVLSAPSGTASSAATTKPASRRGVTARSKGAKGKLRTGASRAPGVAASGSSVTMAQDAAEDDERPENPGCAKKARVDPAESREAPPAAAPKPRPRKPQPPPFTLDEFTLEVLEAYVMFEDFHLHSLGFACDLATGGDAVKSERQEAPDPAQCVAWLADVCHLRRKLSESWDTRQKQGWSEERFLAHVQGKLKDKPLHRQAALHFFGKKTECVSYVSRTPGWYEDPAAFYSRYPDLLAHLSASFRDGRCHPPVYNDFPVIQVE